MLSARFSSLTVVLPVLSALGAPPASAQPSDNQAAAATGRALERACTGMVKEEPLTKRKIVQAPILYECLSVLREQTRAYYEAHSAQFSMGGRIHREFPHMAGVAGTAWDQMRSACGPVYARMSVTNPVQDNLDVTGQIIDCLNQIEETSRIKNISVIYNLTQHHVIGIHAVCVRGIEDIKAKEDCDQMRAMARPAAP